MLGVPRRSSTDGGERTKSGGKQEIKQIYKSMAKSKTISNQQNELCVERSEMYKNCKKIISKIKLKLIYCSQKTLKYLFNLKKNPKLFQAYEFLMK